MTSEELKQLATKINCDLRQIRRLLHRPVANEISRGRLTGAQQSAMRVLLKKEGISLKELSKELGLAHSTVSGIVDRLQKKGLIERKTDQNDLRFNQIVPTQAVRTFLKERWPLLEREPLAEALVKASGPEQNLIHEGIAALRRLLELPDAAEARRKKS